ncbi:SPOR domain-containing protein [Sphingopyxis sp.]|uniref:SPOR domain-containing protein n=1 Tax=Sphingopyxis sp. TaxID=1908224 RepID=UPI002602B2A5|nr:SPOR domain-containing protein [Sphingopyxis sp.]MCW0199633.1 SPOR domain-containing protein [Sphingopyxis sp.]
MRRQGWAAGPGRARRLAAAAGALLLTSAIATPALAFQAATPDAATKAAMDKRTAARTLLSSALGRLATNSNDAAALLDAGRASNELEDYRAAVGFLTRAEQASPRDGAVKAALGSAMVHMESPTRALDYFGEAQLLGAPERLFLADRGLARDLLGQQDAAQRDYQLALSIAPNDEVTRRYALSLGISGEADRAVQLLTPQLRAQDRAAWRLRAMILAMNGRDAEATEIVNATMPPALAQNILPYLTQMDRLNPAQQAAAAHFGRFPSGELGPRRRPVQVAAATPPPPSPSPPATEAGRRSERSRPPVAATPKPKPAPVPAATPTPRPAASKPASVAASRAPAARPPAVDKPAPAAASPSPVPVRADPPAATVAAPAPAAAASVAPIGTNPVQSSTPVGPGFSIADVGRPAPAPAAAPMPPPPSIAPAGSAVTPEAPLASLAAIASSIEIPPEEMARPDNAIGADVLARLREDKKRADAAEEAKREKEEAAAKAKAEAEAKAKAEAAEKKANPARTWVQIATGANAKALAFDYDRFAKKNAALFKGKSAATTEWGRTRRLLVGPFKDRATAQDWLGDYKKAGGDGFLFNSDAGQSVDPVK